MLYSDTVHLMT